MNNQFPWEQDGPAHAIYTKYLQHDTLQQQFVAQIRKSWGQITADDLAAFPHITRESFNINHNSHTLNGYKYRDPSQSCKGHFLYLHGGGWMAPTGGRHICFAKRMAYLTGYHIWALEYSLAPEKPYPQALYEIISLLDYLQQQAESDKAIVIGGDSSGANLAAAAVLYCKKQRLALPSKALLMCGLFDFNFESYDSMQRWAPYHPHQSLSLLAFQRACYIPDSKLWKQDIVSPMHGDLKGFPKTLMIIGQDDVLADDNIEFAKRLTDAKVDVSKHIFQDMPHTFYFHSEEVPTQSQQAVDAMCDFLSEATNNQP